MSAASAAAGRPVSGQNLGVGVGDGVGAGVAVGACVTTATALGEADALGVDPPPHALKVTAQATRTTTAFRGSLSVIGALDRTVIAA
ncbi:MAG TPA: hypothetical protein VIN69_07530 [Candidatus Limnocylindria bacterium]